MNSRFGRHNNEGGVTLLELLVALGIFGLVIVIIFGAFSTSILIERRIIALRNAGDNIRFAIESINSVYSLIFSAKSPITGNLYFSLLKNLIVLV